MIFIDTHSHINHESYNETLSEIIRSAEEKGVKKIIAVGVDLNSSEDCVKIAEKYPNVYAACGFHPHESKLAPPNYLYELEPYYEHPKVVAVGEIGLDYHYGFSETTIQRKIYIEQLELAKSLDMPSIIHCRKSSFDIIKELEFVGNTKGVIHCFSENYEFAKKIIDLGFNISFTGMVTFIEELKEVVKKVPLNKIMIETDSPYLSPKPNRGKKNKPEWVIYIAQEIAEIKNINIDEVAESTTQTALTVFPKMIG